MILFLADAHVGVKLPYEDFDKSLDNMFQIIKEHKEPCDVIMVLGDFFDHNLSIEESCQAVPLLTKLVLNGCGRNGMKHVPVHFIEGTFSHDRKQMRIFMPLIKNLPCSVFYVDTWCKATLCNGMKVLYLPQEYGEVDYTEAFQDHYDLIVGHGPISSQNKQVVTSHGTEIMHSVEMLSEHAKLCVFGHYHEYTDFGNGVYYAGSLLRFRYNEDTPKVFFLCDSKFHVTTIPNPVAKEFKTIEIHNPEQLREALTKPIDTPHRFVIHSDNTDLQTYHAIMDHNKRNPNLSYKMMTQEPVADPLESLNTTETTTTNIVEPVESLVQYISDKYHIDASEEISDYEAKIRKDDKK